MTPFPPQIPYVLQVCFMNIKKKYGKICCSRLFVWLMKSKFLRKDKHNEKLIKILEIANVHKCINYVICVYIYLCISRKLQLWTKYHMWKITTVIFQENFLVILQENYSFYCTHNTHTHTHTYIYMGREIKSSSIIKET